MDIRRRAWDDPIAHLYAGTAIFLLALLALAFWSVRDAPPLVLPWSLAVVEGLSLLAGLSVAFLCLGRYRVLHQPASLWIGVAFLANGALTVLYILSWPGLVWYGGILTDNPNTAHWLYLLKWTTLAGGLLAAAVWGAGSVRDHLPRAVAAGVGAVLAGGLVMLLEERLPLLEVGRRTLPSQPLVVASVVVPLGEVWAALLVVAFLIGSVLALRRYRRDDDVLLGYAAVMQLVAAFILAEAVLGGQRYDFWWYLSRLSNIVAYLIILLGLLTEYVGLYRRERDRAEEARRALAESEMLRDVAQAISGSADVQQVMERVAAHARDHLAAQQAGVLIRADNGAFTWRVPGQAETNGHQRNGFSVADVAALAEHPLCGMAPGAPLPPAVQALFGSETRGVLVVPMVAGSTSCGALLLGYDTPRELDERDLRFAEALAGQAAMAWEQAQARHEAAQAAAAREADRLKSELLATVSHELRTPLGSIKGHATTLARFSAQMEPEERHEFLTAIDRATDRLSELVDNLLLVQRLDAGLLPTFPEPLDLAELAEQIVAETAERTAAHPLSTDVPAGLPAVRGDPRRVRQVLVNLVDNASKYSPAGRPIRVAAEQVGEEVLVSVHDEGEGIPAEHLERVFERFHRLDSDLRQSTSGTGLGLTICQGIVEAHGGRIWAESAGVGRGSTFRFTLPIWKDA
jgi:K+-sensing histidine kinase KdpD